jgi:hypothetical protein
MDAILAAFDAYGADFVEISPELVARLAALGVAVTAGPSNIAIYYRAGVVVGRQIHVSEVANA